MTKDDTSPEDNRAVRADDWKSYFRECMPIHLTNADHKCVSPAACYPAINM